MIRGNSDLGGKRGPLACTASQGSCLRQGSCLQLTTWGITGELK